MPFTCLTYGMEGNINNKRNKYLKPTGITPNAYRHTPKQKMTVYLK